MIDVYPFHGFQVAVLGLGRSGLPTAQALAASGAEVWAWDDSEDRRAEARAAGVNLVDLHKADLRELTTLVLSPGIPHTHPAPHPVATRAREAGLEIVCDVDLLFRCQREAAYVGVTGTNGKSTTTALIGHVLKHAGRRVEVGGNIGTAALSLEPLAGGGTYAIEMSSYQLELAPTAVWDIGVLLNVSPDHLDRHGGMDGYVAAKRTIFQRQARQHLAVVGVDDAISAGIHDALVRADDQKIVAISGSRRLKRGVYVADGTLFDARDGNPAAIRDLSDCLTLPGAHNHQNAAAAAAVALNIGIAPARIAEALDTYPGLAHRQERIATLDGVLFVNDSKATNADAAARALGCYENIHWIAGGQAKEGGIESLRAFFPRIAHAWLIGEAANDFARTLGDVPHTVAGDLATAVRSAAKAAKPGSVVLLSPACASWDQFRNFEHRGETFRGLVAGLSGMEGLAA
ncbi:MAG: UDP-N-acetylmuramoyl-L-alanine--D-glutamate ligase [Rhodospirillales bacterium]|nr:UDP-N-acetylmuramoyl-L-alanine--D-glutamate ligase [Rhodospirillales bacterium]